MSLIPLESSRGQQCQLSQTLAEIRICSLPRFLFANVCDVMHKNIVNTFLLHIIFCTELCAHLLYKLSIIHHIRIQNSCILPRCAAADKVLTDYLGLRPR